MDISFHCKKCGQHILIDEAGAGLAVHCPSCRENLSVPKNNQEPAAKTSANENSKKCPFCAEVIKKEAKVCRYCGRDLIPLPSPSVSGACLSSESETTPNANTDSPEPAKRKHGAVFVLIVVVACLAAVIYLLNNHQQVAQVFKPKLPDFFKQQAREFLSKAGKLEAATSSGVSYLEFKQQVQDTMGAFRTLDDAWPIKPVVEGRFRLSSAIRYWAASHDAWASKVRGDYTIPNDIITDVVVAQTSHTDLTFDVRDRDMLIRSLMTAASREYRKGKEDLVKAINK